jgi:energy-coupling factor transporter transmembrane protein EcfT
LVTELPSTEAAPGLLGRPVGVYGCLGLLTWAALAPGLLPGRRVYWALGTVVAVSWLLGTRQWRSLGAPRTWLFVAGLAALGAAAQYANGSGAAGWAGLELGLRMAARAVAILAAADMLSAHVPLAELAGLFEGLGLSGLGFALGVAFNMLPAVRRTAANTFDALRQRGVPWYRPRAWRRLALTVLALTLARAQEVVDAAEARGFAPGRGRLPRPAWRPGDVGLLVALVAWGAALALI